MPTSIHSSAPKGILLSRKPIILWIHDPSSAYSHDAVVNPDLFPAFREGQLLRIHCARTNQQAQTSQSSSNARLDQQDQKKHQDPPPQQSQPQQRYQLNDGLLGQRITYLDRQHEGSSSHFDSVIVKGHAVDRENLAKQQQLQLSISKDIADRFNLRSRQEVYVELINPLQVALDYVELGFKEQYLGRSDMWRLQQNLKGTCVYLEKKILFAGSIKATVKRLFSQDSRVTSGYITETTRVIFRSASAKYFLFIQMSREMWEFDEDGELYFEKAVSNFLPHLFSKWKEEGTNHVVSVILFTRVFYETKIDDTLIIQASDGRFYKDFYKVIADWETTDDWTSIISLLKKEQLTFQSDILMRTENGRKLICGQISMVYEGNVLEAVNLALNPFDKHYVDRDLMRTGLSIILITPGVGKFWVNKKLLRLTNERMTDNGIAMDLVCLSPVPLHVTPLMCYMDAPFTGDVDNTAPLADNLAPRTGVGRPSFLVGNSPEKSAMYPIPIQKNGFVDPLYRDSTDAPTQVFYSVPHWIDCSFYHHETGRFQKQDKFKTRCKMYELQMMGIMEHDLQGISLPYLKNSGEHGNTNDEAQLLRQQRSSSSLYDKLRAAEDGKHSPYFNNGEAYLSKSATMPSNIRRPSFLTTTEMTPLRPEKNSSAFEKQTTPSLENYDDAIFKTSTEPRFTKKMAGPTSASAPGKINKAYHSTRSSFDGQERNDLGIDGSQSASARFKTWHHAIDQRKIPSILSYTQQVNGRSFHDSQFLPPRKEDRPNIDPFRVSPNVKDETAPRIRPTRRGTVQSTEIKYTSATESGQQQSIQQQSRQQQQQQQQKQQPQQLQQPQQSQQPQQQKHLQVAAQPNNEEDEFTVISSSTVEPVPINNKGFSGRSDMSRKGISHSPRQGLTSSSLTSVHKQSEGSDITRTSFGANNALNITKSSPSYALNRHDPFKHILINPCNPSENQNLFTSHLRRWQHALPKVEPSDGPVVHWRSLVTPACLPLTTDYFPSNEELAQHYNHYMYTVSASEDTNLYQAGDRNLSEHKKTENLLIEMLSQRLAQGFQIIVDSTGSSNYTKAVPAKAEGVVSALGGGLSHLKNKDGHGTLHAVTGKDLNQVTTSSLRATGASSTSNHPTTTLATTMAIGGNTKSTPANNNATPVIGKALQENVEKTNWKHQVWWLSMGHQVHQLTFDSSGQNVEVRRYVRMIQFDDSKIKYKCAVWPKNMPAYKPRNVKFNYPSLMYAWNYLDHLVAGYQEELTDNLRFWRARFIVIPRKTLPTNITYAAALHENLNEEEKRIALFELWIQNIRRAKWLNPEEREELQKKHKKEIGFSDLGIRLTTMDPSAYVASDTLRAALQPVMTESKSHSNLLSSIISGQSLSKESKSKDIALAMQDSKIGLRITDRRWHFRLFNDVFTGTEFVDWLISHFEEVTTREQAVQCGNTLMQRKPPLFYSATKRHNFLDGNYYYTLHEDYVIDRKKSSKANRKQTGNNDSAAGSAVSTPIKEKDNDSNALRQIPSTQSSISLKRVEYNMSQSMIIDVDPYKKSARRETAILHYDTIHNPNNCYHFQLNWLGCTAQLVQELLQNWSRQADRCGLKLVEGSVEQAYEDLENNNPFQCPVPISLAVPPPPIEELTAMSKINVPAQFYEIALVRHLDYVLDVEADSNFEVARAEGVDLEYSYIKDTYNYDQYIHRSGVSFVQIRPNREGFFWVNNRLYTNHTPALIANRRQPSSQFSHPDTLRTEFQKHCSDKQWLTEFWETTRAHFKQGLDPDSVEAWVFENCGAIVEPDSRTATSASMRQSQAITTEKEDKLTEASLSAASSRTASATELTINTTPNLPDIHSQQDSNSPNQSISPYPNIAVTISAASPNANETATFHFDDNTTNNYTHSMNNRRDNNMDNLNSKS
ncbi:hypothetical protein BDF20DRAFT_913299 [Mycotypha africana]|uniref:uncharacterized protein n=1 Tax=Mycotypha africana TaxID=64632 RepID=UPI002301A9ED|nr:uncharacterized protein BDF20DRAFT_913299 [Mycotypha africana]KAI8979791.1 hypothetical protein BDF20DRAFT_913299 [Mycotypha africana]